MTRRNWNPYSARRTSCAWETPASSSTSSALPVATGAPGSTAPRREHGRISTRGSRRSRLTLPLPEGVVTRSDPSTSGATQTGVATGAPEQLVAALARPDVKKAQAQILAWQAEGARVAASCVGTFLLAETGLLDGREATTT